MKKFLLAAASLAALTVSASAADMAARPMYAKAAPPVVAPVYNWTGLYIGIQGGYKWADHRISRLDAAGAIRIFGGLPLDDTNRATGGFFGGHIGYNYQAGMWVFGVEGDGEWSGAKYGPTTIAAAPNVDYNYGRIDWQASLRGRVGFTATDKTLLYLTGGVAFASIYSRVDVGGLNNQFIAYTQTVPGWVVGGGLEQVITGNLTGRIEGRYTAYNDIRQASAAGATATFLTRTRETSIRGGLSWKFGM